jgi:hypothetical protein
LPNALSEFTHRDEQPISMDEVLTRPVAHWLQA